MRAYNYQGFGYITEPELHHHVFQPKQEICNKIKKAIFHTYCYNVTGCTCQVLVAVYYLKSVAMTHVAMLCFN